MISFVPIPVGSDFPLHNLPYGCCRRRSDSGRRRLCVALGEHVVDLGALQAAGLFSGPVLSGSNCFSQVLQLPRTAALCGGLVQHSSW